MSELIFLNVLARLTVNANDYQFKLSDFSPKCRCRLLMTRGSWTVS